MVDANVDTAVDSLSVGDSVAMMAQVMVGGFDVHPVNEIVHHPRQHLELPFGLVIFRT